jgi:Holliday junction resolvase
MRRGLRFEREVKNLLKAMDYIAIRSAASREVADVVAIKWGCAWLIQCKESGRLSKKEREALITAARQAGVTPILAQKVNGAIFFYRLWCDLGDVLWQPERDPADRGRG